MDIRRIIRDPRIWFAIGLIAVGAAARLLPSPPNVAPIAALALLGGATLPVPWAFLVPGGAMLISDFFIGFDQLSVTISIYVSFLLMGLIGKQLPKQFRPFPLLGASILGSFLFYFVTNAAVWKFSPLYPQTFDGLLLSYYYALPFFRNTLGGDLFYVFTFFGIYHSVPFLVSKMRYLFTRRSSVISHARKQEF